MFLTSIKIEQIYDTQELSIGNKSLLVRSILAQSKDKKMAFKVWNDLTKHPKLIEGETLDIEFKIESKVVNERFYTDLTILKIS